MRQPEKWKCVFPYAVAFKIYDLNDTEVIEKDEVKRLLIQLLKDNPAIDLTNDEVDTIVEQVLLQHQKFLSGTPGICQA